jgi:hypothetical protein
MERRVVAWTRVIDMSETRDHQLIREMRKTAGDYHLHFSTVRTASNSLIVPIGILASINLLDHCRAAQGLAPMLLILFVFGVALALNVAFASWSRACRRIERYYERLLADDTVRYEPARHGFRHVFRTVTVEPSTAERRRAEDPRYPAPLRPWVFPGKLFDLFVGLLVVAFLAYLAIYSSMLHGTSTCADTGVEAESVAPDRS